MKYKAMICMTAAMAMAAMPLSSASAHDHWRHGGPLVGLVALGAAVVVGTAAILTAPVTALAASPPPAPYYIPPQPAPMYAAGPAYYPAPYPAPVYYAQPRVYYAPAPMYYYGR